VCFGYGWWPSVIKKPARKLQKITYYPTEEEWKAIGLEMPVGLKGQSRAAATQTEEAPKEKEEKKLVSNFGLRHH
jgi:hypothetical protein